jgi:hypothetical protein
MLDDREQLEAGSHPVSRATLSQMPRSCSADR